LNSTQDELINSYVLDQIKSPVGKITILSAFKETLLELLLSFYLCLRIMNDKDRMKAIALIASL